MHDDPGSSTDLPLPEVPSGDVDTAAPPVVPVPPRRRRWPLVAGGVALVLIAGAAFAAVRLAGSGDVLLRTVPDGAEVVLTAYLDPDASQKTNLLRMVSRFPEVGDEAALRARVDEWLDEAFADVGLTHADAGWVGSQALVWFDLQEGEEPMVAVVIDVDDEEAATAALERVRAALEVDGPSETYEGVPVTTTPEGSWALADDVLVVGSNPEAVHAVIDTAAGRSSSIETSASFTATTADLPEEVLGLLYIDVGAITDQLPASMIGATGATGGGAASRVAFTVSAQPDGLVMDAVTTTDTTGLDPEVKTRLDTVEPNEALGALPADSFAAMSMGDLDVAIHGVVDALSLQDQRVADDLDEMGVTGPNGIVDMLRGDIAFGISPAAGEVPVGGVIVVGTTDAAGLESFIDERLADLGGGTIIECQGPDSCIEKEGPLAWTTTEHDGVTIHVATGSELPVAWAIADDLAIVGLSSEDVAGAIDAARTGTGIGTNARYSDAVRLVEADGQMLFLDMVALIETVRGALGPDELAQFDNEVAPYLEPIDMIAAGSHGDATTQHARVVIQIP